MEINKEGVAREIFKHLMDDILSFYKKKISKLETKNKNHYEACKKIRAIENVENFIKPKHGLGKHIFAKKGAHEYYYSVGAIIAHELEKRNKKLDIDITDFIYKKCNAFSNNASEIDIYDTFFEVLDYKNIKEYCTEKGLEYSESATRKNKKSANSYGTDRELKLQNNLLGGWWLYFYKNEGFGKDPSLASAILEVENLKSLKIFNSHTDSSINYIGQLDDSLVNIGGVIYLKFNPVDSKERRNLRIALHITEDVNINLSIGQYTNIDRGTHLIRGSVCMERIINYKIGDCEKEKNRLLPKRNTEDIPPQFKRFLADKDLNFNRLPKNQYNLNSFNDWLSEQMAKHNYLNKKIAIQNKKLFISCPINSVSPKQFNELKEVVDEITNFFKSTEIGFTEVHSVISDLENQEAKASIPSALEYQEVMRKFKDCSYHLAIWPHDLGPSGILFEIGWAVMNKRPVVIFEQFVHKPNEQIKSQIPHLLLGACENKKTDIIKYPFNEFKEILNILRKNKLNIFPNQLPNDYLF